MASSGDAAPPERPPRLGYRARMALGVQRYLPADEAGLLEFRRSIFGAYAPQADPRYFHWQCGQNPNQEPDQPQVWIYKKDGEIIGQQVGLPVQLKAAGAMLSGSWGLDLIVRPEDRVRGIGALLSERFVAENQVVMGLGVSDEASRALVRGGWTDLGRVPLFVRPLLVGPLVEALGYPAFLHPFGVAADAPLRWAGKLSQLSNLALELNPVNRFDDRLEEIWQRSATYYPVIGRRDAATLNWRYLEHPDPARYQALLISVRGQALGYAILRMGRWRDLSSAYLIDLLAPPGGLPWLLLRVLQHCREQGAALVQCLHSSREVARAMRWLGFITRDSGLRMMMHARADVLAFNPVLSQLSNWFVCAGDSDADRPRSDD